MSDEKEQIVLKKVIEHFIAETNLFISEYYVEVLEEKLISTTVFLHDCSYWTIDEKEEIINELNNLQEALLDRIKDLNPDSIVGEEEFVTID